MSRFGRRRHPATFVQAGPGVYYALIAGRLLGEVRRNDALSSGAIGHWFTDGYAGVTRAEVTDWLMAQESTNG